MITFMDLSERSEMVKERKSKKQSQKEPPDEF